MVGANAPTNVTKPTELEAARGLDPVTGECLCPEYQPSSSATGWARAGEVAAVPAAGGQPGDWAVRGVPADNMEAELIYSAASAPGSLSMPLPRRADRPGLPTRNAGQPELTPANARLARYETKTFVDGWWGQSYMHAESGAGALRRRRCATVTFRDRCGRLPSRCRGGKRAGSSIPSIAASGRTSRSPPADRGARPAGSPAACSLPTWLTSQVASS